MMALSLASTAVILITNLISLIINRDISLSLTIYLQIADYLTVISYHTAVC